MRKLLLVEDEEILRDTYSTLLSTQPYFLDTAENGQVALEKCLIKNYDLILLDLMMPVMDGVTFLERLQNRGSHAPRVLVLSNLSSGDALERAITLGASRSLLKSNLSPRELLAVVRYELESIS